MLKPLSKAVIAGTLAVPVALTVQALLFSRPAGSFMPYLEGLLAWCIAGSAAALLILLVYGVPSFLLLRKHRLANVLTCCITAALPSGLLAIWSKEPVFFFQYGYISLVSALAFWLFARQVALQPNNSFKPKPLRGSA